MHALEIVMANNHSTIVILLIGSFMTLLCFLGFLVFSRDPHFYNCVAVAHSMPELCFLWFYIRGVHSGDAPLNANIPGPLF